MNLIVYLSIFAFIMLEEALKTLRIIVVSNGKKIIGAILQFFIALIWIIVTGTVIMDIKGDPLKIFFYSLGSLVGSYIGSLIEEKIAWGTNVIMVEINNNLANIIIEKIKPLKYKINILKSSNENHELLMITAPRKKTNDIINIIRTYDKNINIICEKVKTPNH